MGELVLLDRVAGDTADALEWVLLETRYEDDPTLYPIDLRGASARLYLVHEATGVTKVDGAAVAIADPAKLGRVRYAWQPADVDRPGSYLIRIVVIFGDGRPASFPVVPARMTIVPGPAPLSG